MNKYQLQFKYQMKMAVLHRPTIMCRGISIIRCYGIFYTI